MFEELGGQIFIMTRDGVELDVFNRSLGKQSKLAVTMAIGQAQGKLKEGFLSVLLLLCASPA